MFDPLLAGIDIDIPNPQNLDYIIYLGCFKYLYCIIHSSIGSGTLYTLS